jgi:enamine deaminase RidA (YjgF/YER057c/UK114 family)
VPKRGSTTAKLFASTTASRYQAKVVLLEHVYRLKFSQPLGGWDRLTDEFPESIAVEVDQAFDNVEYALQQAGGKGLEQVYKTRIYITVPVDEIEEPIIRNLKGRFKAHSPLLTVVQVVSLYKTMRIEIEAEAHLE